MSNVTMEGLLPMAGFASNVHATNLKDRYDLKRARSINVLDIDAIYSNDLNYRSIVDLCLDCCTRHLWQGKHIKEFSVLLLTLDMMASKVKYPPIQCAIISF